MAHQVVAGRKKMSPALSGAACFDTVKQQTKRTVKSRAENGAGVPAPLKSTDLQRLTGRCATA
jgi:hypothetical protein